MKISVFIAVSLFTVGAFAQKPSTKPVKASRESGKVAPTTTTPVTPAPVVAPASTTTQAPATIPSTPSKLVFKELTVDQGEIKYDSKEPFVFECKNTGKESVLITEARASCGCTVPQKPTEAIAKGKTDKIVVTYDTKRVGAFTKTITVTASDSVEPILLTIKGTVMPAPIVDPQIPATTPSPELHNH